MIYDRILTVYELSDTDSPLDMRLTGGISYYYAEAEVYSSRYYQARQAGNKISLMSVIPLDAQVRRIPTETYVILADCGTDGQVYRVIQAQYGRDDDFLPVTRLSLQAMEGKYELFNT